MAVNKNHPDYPKYIEKCKALRDSFIEEEDAVLDKYPTPNGLDHPAARELRQISILHNAALKALQEEYSYLFETE